MCDQGKRKKKEKFQYNKSIMAATSVVVLDRGNNTTCTVNLHGATVVSWRVNNQEQLFVRGWCNVKTTCGLNGCEAMHHKLLHGALSVVNEAEKHCLTHSASNDHTLFRYVPVTVHGNNGRTVKTFAFLDEGSSATFMDHSLLEELGLSGLSKPLSLRWTGDTTREETTSVQLPVRISGEYQGAIVHELAKVHTVKNLALPAQSVSTNQLGAVYPHLKGLPLTSYVNATPRILIGVDNCRLGKPLKCAEGRVNEPIATKTRLGWILYGPCPIATINVAESHRSFHICSSDDNMDGTLTAEVKAFFSLDSLGIVKLQNPLKSKDDERALEILRKETKLQGDRFVTGLLWKYDDIRLPCNKAAALKRHQTLKKKMEKDPELAVAVNAKMSDYIQKGYIRRLSASEAENKQLNDWFLPIFPVTNPNKPGKIRMVFDAAAKVSGVSLNSFLLPGPDLLAGLLSVLFKFREYRIAVVGDIREMFHQVTMRKQDQRSQMIFWDGDEPHGDPAVYAVTVMTFGAACSPSSAQFVKNRNAERFEKQYPRAALCIRDEHYVDDMLVSVETEIEAVTLAKEVRYVHAQGGFEIRNWVSNSTLVVNQLQAQAEQHKGINMGYDLTTEKVLGMWWDTASDTFTFRLSGQFKEKLQAGTTSVTKRNLLRILMSVYDPMGLLGLFLMFLKVLLQEIWRSGIGWDQELDGHLAEKWRTWQSVLPEIQNVKISRCHRRLTSIRARVQLHVFCDASETGMAAVAYLRFEEDEVIECALVGSKTRVAPMRFVSIPRLELQAAVIGARLAATIIASHRLNISRTLFWTDSRNVLSWLRSDHRRYNQFVAFRVGELLETTDVEQWRWISTKLNVADDGTKWTRTPDLSPTSRWFTGPSFLWNSESLWPGYEMPPTNTPEELRPSVLHHSVVDPLVDFHRFSKWKRLLRTVAYVVRFVANIRRAMQKDVILGGPLIQEELAQAERIVINQIQADVYAYEIRCLKKTNSQLHPWKTKVEQNSSLYKLSPVLDEHGLIRMRGRLAETLSISETLRQPIILPRKHRGTELLILDYHERYKHCNHRTVVSELRARYYIPRVLGEYNRVRNSCQRCKVDGAKPESPSMGNIPHQRTAVGQRAFSFTGVDYFGPLLVAVGRRVEKRWGVLFTCLTSRAIHLEMAHSLTTASCIMAIRRFIARRGKPLEMISDRGTNFVGSARELEEALRAVDHDALMVEFTGPEMNWSFNPPAAPHFGGCWERLVRSVKKVMGQFDLPRKPTDEVLMSTFAEIELIINSRPLTYVPLNDEMDTPLTPNHLLLGSSNGCKPPCVFADGEAVIKSSWRAAQHNAEVFWKRWVADYLPMLTRRSKWFKNVRPIQVGDIVIIVDNSLPRNSWPKGRVVEVVRANDGQVRQASVQTNNGIFKRPATKLALLDVKPKILTCDIQDK